MNYCYDLKLNFQNNNCFFYEWDRNDDYTFVTKIPCIYISTTAMEDILANKVKINQEINGCKILLIDKNCVIALLLDNEGKEIGRSYLSLDDELRIIDNTRGKEPKELNYTILSKIEYDEELRQEKIIKDIINKEITKIEEDKNYQKLKYLYMEWFNKNSNNWDQMLKRIKEKLRGNITDDELKVYELIKLSYKKI